uniref:Uncharacterized protein n=1 Tax=Lepeophtheirus salmonis TaxID=72036 RepID=A0A0K2UNS1_LEPSM
MFNCYKIPCSSNQFCAQIIQRLPMEKIYP